MVSEAGRVAGPKLLARLHSRIGEMLPGLHSWRHHEISSTQLRPRSFNILRRSGLVTWGDVAKLTPDRLFSIRGIGCTIAQDIAARCIELSSMPHPDETNADSADISTTRQQLTRPEESERPSSEDLRVLAAWAFRERSARRLADIVQLQPGLEGVPTELLALWDRYGNIPLSDFADDTVRNVTLDAVADSLFESLDDRLRTIYRLRVVHGATLAAVGKELGVTRERIRQLQQHLDRRLAKRLSTIECRLLRWRAADLRASLGTAAPAMHQVTRLALQKSLGTAKPTTAELLRPLLLRIAGPYHERDGWLTLDPSDLDPSGVGDMANQFGIVSMTDAREWLIGRGIRSEFHKDWIEHTRQFRQNGNHLMIWSGNVVDKCVALLASRNEPADAETLVEVVGEGHSVRGVQEPPVC